MALINVVIEAGSDPVPTYASLPRKMSSLWNLSSVFEIAALCHQSSVSRQSQTVPCYRSEVIVGMSTRALRAVR
jgi:hypothetical protein